MPSEDTQWKPGQSGNPNGRPKKKPFKDALLKLIAEQGLDMAANALLQKALEGDVPALKELADRIDGKVTQTIGGDDDEDAITVRTIVTGVPRPDDAGDN